MAFDQMRQQIGFIRQQLTLAHRKMGNFIARGVLTLMGMDGSNINIVQGKFLANETISDLQHPQEYGFASKPLPGAYIIAMFNGGNRDHGQALTIYDPRVNPTDLGNGETCQYDSSNNRVWLKNTDGILIKNDTNEITLNSAGISITDKNGNIIAMTSTGIAITAASNVTFNSPVIFNNGWTLNGGTGAGTGSVSVTGNVSDGVGSMSKMRGEYNAHIHTTPAGNSGPTTEPMD